ncbi:hypothetical protein SDRG_11067 [Saprolegnia diclina VS20]|uniref:Disintegrin domain-containing protein n=1 Tax=Saprolegnia diclina (strain VS20) TaxID=1156394 RepID=T0QD63_SAPDV|nr:hypothetical protein SDRG_11067 [Saprolegnia diclina VS20]EQC31470.1 hypothetical protein SDRG_11067 [Saprolegnia diclina VS20]|eukprot:XP_008615311.1 hypothetical protein SDRG_11067 [Saprolegnia diclina VS20]
MKLRFGVCLAVAIAAHANAHEGMASVVSMVTKETTATSPALLLASNYLPDAAEAGGQAYQVDEATKNAEKATEKAEKAAEKAEKAAKKYDKAKTAADDAKKVADDAKTAADDAKKVADNAKKVADDAKTAADDAKKVADDAKKVADDAKAAADDAKKAQVVAKKAQEEAKEALEETKKAQEAKEGKVNDDQAGYKPPGSYDPTYPDESIDVYDDVDASEDKPYVPPSHGKYDEESRYRPAHVEHNHYQEDSIDSVTIADEDGCPEVPCHEISDFLNGKCTYTQLPRGTLCPSQSCDNGGECDADEKDYCDGEGKCLNGYKDQNSVCRGARNLCDEAEYCSGDHSKCPGDEFAPTTKVCTKMGKSTGGPCDAPDYCDGNGHCVDKYQPTKHVCRRAVDVCDVAETCTGVSGDCPSNSFASKRTICTSIGSSSGGACDDIDRCNGHGKCVDHFKGTSHLCRRQVDVCDEPEYCPGECGVCPDDALAPVGKVCTQIGKSSGGACDGVDVCDGRGSCVETFLGSDVVCREACDICDVPEFCTGYNGKCPRDKFAPRTTECTPIGESSDHACDGVDYCDGSGKCVDKFEKDTLCHVAEDLCDSSHFCNGASADCPRNNEEAHYGDDYASVFAYKARQCSAKAAHKFVSVYDAPGNAALLLVAVAMVGALAAIVAVSASKKEAPSAISMEDGYVPLTQDMH